MLADVAVETVLLILKIAFLILLYLFGYKLKLFPLGTYCEVFTPPSGTQCGGVIQWFWHLVLPWFTFAALYAALYDSIAAHSRSGLNVVVDVGHHDAKILADCARRLSGLPVLFVGVRCPIDVVMERRNAGQIGREDEYAVGSETEPIPRPVALWQEAVHIPGIYDLEVDTSRQSPEECAEAIRRRLDDGPPPSAFRRLAKI